MKNVGDVLRLSANTYLNPVWWAMFANPSASRLPLFVRRVSSPIRAEAMRDE